MCSPLKKRCHHLKKALLFHASLKTLENKPWHAINGKILLDFRDVRVEKEKYQTNHKKETSSILDSMKYSIH